MLWYAGLDIRENGMTWTQPFFTFPRLQNDRLVCKGKLVGQLVENRKGKNN